MRIIVSLLFAMSFNALAQDVEPLPPLPTATAKAAIDSMADVAQQHVSALVLASTVGAYGRGVDEFTCRAEYGASELRYQEAIAAKDAYLVGLVAGFQKRLTDAAKDATAAAAQESATILYLHNEVGRLANMLRDRFGVEPYP